MDTPLMYETSGKLKWIGDVQSFPSGFTKREFVVTTSTDRYPQDLKFEIVKDKCSLLDPFEIGQDVEVSFDIRGNEYNGKYYVNLSCWKIQAMGSGPGTSTQNSGQVSTKTSSESSPEDLRNEEDFDDVPF